jgi:hypothetical protein
MSDFSELYGTDLDRELGSADRTQLFTTVRRKSAVNQGQVEFVRLTECLVSEETEALVDETQEYDLLSIIASNKFMKFATRQPYIKKVVTATSATTYLTGESFKFKPIEDLDRDEEGWRGASSGTPMNWYLRDDGSSVYLGLHPKPNIPSTETWTVIIPYVTYPTALSADADVPFGSRQNLRAYHQALVHYAAAQLEKLRRNYQVSSSQLEAFLAYVHEFIAGRKPSGGERVSFAHNYFAAASVRPARPEDPRR